MAIYASRLDASCLSCHFLTAVSSLGDRRGDITKNKVTTTGLDKISWELVLSCPRSDILVACKSVHFSKSLSLWLTSCSACLASCVLTRDHVENLHTSTVVEIWDYLRDVLILVLTGYYLGDEAPLSFLVAPTLCEAMLVLLHRTGDRLGDPFFSSVENIDSDSPSIKVTWTLRSPWTKDLCKELRILLREDENALSKTHVVLKTRLATAGKTLVHTVSSWYLCHGRVNVPVVGERVGRRRS